MKLTKIEKQKHQKERYSLYIDNDFYMGIQESVLIFFSLYKGMELTEKQLSEIKEVEYREKIYNKAINYLSYGLRSVKEMHVYLNKLELTPPNEPAGIEEPKTIDSDLIWKTIEKLKEQNYLNDVLFGQSYVRTVALINRKGPSLIKQELIKKGLESETIQLSLLEYPDEQIHENCLYLAEKYLRTKSNQAPKILKNKMRLYLIQKGFDSETIQMVMEEVDFSQVEEKEKNLLAKEAEKVYKRLEKKYSDRQLEQKLKESLYRKGFKMDDISRWLVNHLSS